MSSGHPDRTCSLGAGLVEVAEAVRSRLPVLHRAEEVMARLVEVTGFGCSLTHVGAERLTVLARVGSPDRFPQARLNRVPLNRIPLATATRRRFRELLATARTHGLGTRAMARGSAGLFEALARLLGALSTHPAERDLRAEIAEVFGAIGSRPYTADELARPGTRSVSYLVAPVSDADGVARHEIECHVMRPRVGDRELRRWHRQVLDTARELAAGA